MRLMVRFTPSLHTPQGAWWRVITATEPLRVQGAVDHRFDKNEVVPGV